MARAGRKDRGLASYPNTRGQLVWMVRLWQEGRERKFRGFRTKTAAREFYEKAKAEQSQGRFFPERYHHGSAKLKDLIDEYMGTNTNKTAHEDLRYARFWKAWFPGITLKGITPQGIEKAKLHLGEQMIGANARLRAPQTVLHYLKFLRRVLNLAVRNGRLQLSPIAQVKLPKASKGRLRFLSLEEEGRLCEAIGEARSPWIRLAILTGLRREEQFGLRWAEIDLDAGILTIPQTKAGGTRYVPLNAEAKAILQGMDTWHRSVWVFPSQNPMAHYDSDNFYRRLYLPAVKKAGIEGVTWHTLRHTFASRLAMAGATEQDIATCLGHSTTSLVRRYAHLSPAHVKGVMEKVSAFGTPRGSAPNQNGTVPETGQVLADQKPDALQLAEKIGAGDGI